MLSVNGETLRTASAAQTYLENHQLHVYIEDAVALLLEDRAPDPAKFLAEYFERLKNGSQILLRDYEYITATPRNRFAFCSRLEEILHHFNVGHQHGEKVTYCPQSIHQYAMMICPDFPYAVTEKAYSLCSPPVSILEFIKSLRVMLIFKEYVEAAQRSFQDIFGDAQQPKASISEENFKKFIAVSSKSCIEMGGSLPPKEVQQNISMRLVQHGSRVSFQDFLSKLIDNKAMQSYISIMVPHGPGTPLGASVISELSTSSSGTQGVKVPIP